MIWINGERQSDEARHLSARDRGFTLADGLFETMRVHRGVVFRLESHLARLRQGLRVLEIPEPADLRAWLFEAVRAAGTGDVSVRLTVTRGPGLAGLAPPPDVRPTTVIAASPLPAFPASLYEVGLAARIASGRRNERAMTVGLKTVAYTDAVAALLEARRAGADEALFLDTEGHLSEATASNLFVCVEGRLVTPPVSCGALPGITRAVVLDLAPAAGIEVEERAFDRDVLLRAEEAFLTSSLRSLAPLVQVDGRPIGTGRPGDRAQRLLALYRGHVEQECAA